MISKPTLIKQTQRDYVKTCNFIIHACIILALLSSFSALSVVTVRNGCARGDSSQTVLPFPILRSI